jgi:hypothetical protein
MIKVKMRDVVVQLYVGMRFYVKSDDKKTIWEIAKIENGAILVEPIQDRNMSNIGTIERAIRRINKGEWEVLPDENNGQI